MPTRPATTGAHATSATSRTWWASAYAPAPTIWTQVVSASALRLISSGRVYAFVCQSLTLWGTTTTIWIKCALSVQ